MTWALASDCEPPRSDHLSPLPVTRVVRGKRVHHSRTIVRHSRTVVRQSQNFIPPNELVRRWRTTVRGERSFTPSKICFLANCSSPSANVVRGGPVRGERLLEGDGFPPANEFSGEPFASSRRSTGELGRTLANSAELRRTFGILRRTFAAVRRGVGVGEPLASSRGVRPSSLEFARIRLSSRRTTVRRVYCPTSSLRFTVSTQLLATVIFEDL